MKSAVLLAAAGLFLGSQAFAQSASVGSPGGEPASTPPTTQDNPVTKPNNNGVPVSKNRQMATRMPKIVTETDATYVAEQKRDDHNMNICIGCD